MLIYTAVVEKFDFCTFRRCIIVYSSYIELTALIIGERCRERCRERYCRTDCRLVRQPVRVHLPAAWGIILWGSGDGQPPLRFIGFHPSLHGLLCFPSFPSLRFLTLALLWLLPPYDRRHHFPSHLLLFFSITPNLHKTIRCHLYSSCH